MPGTACVRLSGGNAAAPKTVLIKAEKTGRSTAHAGAVAWSGWKAEGRLLAWEGIPKSREKGKTVRDPFLWISHLASGADGLLFGMTALGLTDVCPRGPGVEIRAYRHFLQFSASLFLFDLYDIRDLYDYCPGKICYTFVFCFSWPGKAGKSRFKLLEIACFSICNISCIFFEISPGQLTKSALAFFPVKAASLFFCLLAFARKFFLWGSMQVMRLWNLESIQSIVPTAFRKLAIFRRQRPAQPIWRQCGLRLKKIQFRLWRQTAAPNT